MDYLREAFRKIKEDMDSLREELNSIKEDMNKNTQFFTGFTEILVNLKKDLENVKKEKNSSFRQTDTSTDRQTENTTFPAFQTHNSTHNSFFRPSKAQIYPFSTGNEGASTDRQTDTSTDRQTQIFPKDKDSIKNALDFLDSLDSIKKEIRLKFKCITDQEFLVFSTIYHLDEEYGGTDYKDLSKKLNLSESSIRDYVGRLLKKEIPIQKEKINNKSIRLSISSDLKKIASLSTILQLRDI